MRETTGLRHGHRPVAVPGRMHCEPLGRGPKATLDMKLRIADLKARGADVIEELWRRHINAIAGDGYEYEYAEDRRERTQSF